MDESKLLIKKNSSGHSVIRLHYTADPQKASDEWIQKQSSRYIGGVNSLDWRREMEIDFSAGSGELVFPELYERKADFLIDPWDVKESDGTIFAGMDWGNRNYVSVHAYLVTHDLDFISIWEYFKLGTETNVHEVAKALHRDCPYYDRIQQIYYDPAMNREDQQREQLDDKTSVARMFQEDMMGEYIVDKLATAAGRSDVAAIQKTRYLMFGKEKPKVKFFKTCPHQWREFSNLKYGERRESVNESEKLLDKDNHSWDDFKYFLLSNPYAITEEKQPDFGTLAYLNKITDLAKDISDQSGRPVQEVFNDIYGTNL